jgi:transcriptional regulator of acetoin/glycerol metabolism
VDATRTLTAADDDPSAPPVPAAYLMIALDCARPLMPAARLWLDTAEVSIGRGANRTWSRDDDRLLRLDLPDAHASSVHVRLLREGEPPDAKWSLEDPGSKNGTLLNGRRVQRAELADRDVIEVGNTFLVFRTGSHRGTPRDEIAPQPGVMVLPETLNPSWSLAVSTALRVARGASPIFLLGETGTGKEVLARAIHAASERNGPFVAVNCGAMVRTLIESELFGVRKGAYSGAGEDRLGLVRAADGGTLFLDEVAELPEASQVALLRVLQEREVLPVGATEPIAVDIRVLAATREDLPDRVADGRFRADLYARLAGHIVHVPSLASRIEDVGLLIADLLPRLAGERAASIKLARTAGRALLLHSWPFNVRELEQALRAAIAIASGPELTLTDLPEALRGDAQIEPRPAAPTANNDDERNKILAALEACAGNQTRAARTLGISRATLVNKLALHRIPRPRKQP